MTRRRRRNPDMGGFTAKDLIVLGGVGVGAYLLYQLFQGAKNVGASAAAAVGGAYTNTVSSAGNVLNNWLGPSLIGTNVYYTAIFPDGSSHAVPSNTVDANGNFTWTGYPAGSSPAQNLTLAQDANGNWLALST